MPRIMLSDEHWPKLRQILLREAIYNKRDLRMTVEGMLYRMRVGCRATCLCLRQLGAFQCMVRVWQVAQGASDPCDADPDMEWVFHRW
ncbi:hypothetical protein GCM10017624_21470 [Azotobacter vinelandii]|nr:hypothetical protein GCM10017624_21470 [Azotobacter vinelandii]SFY28316.1 Putative transposase of IS4/5 family [Azotobacter vinelandii]